MTMTMTMTMSQHNDGKNDEKQFMTLHHQLLSSGPEGWHATGEALH